MSAHKKNLLGPLVATNGIAEGPKSLSLDTLVQQMYDLNLKKDWMRTPWSRVQTRNLFSGDSGSMMTNA